MERTRKSIQKCCFCKKPLIGEDAWGNNPEPLREKGRCCNDCNWMYVIPARMAALSGRMKETANVQDGD